MSPEARTGKRFPLELPIRIHGEGANTKSTTADLSAAGVFIRTAKGLRVGSKIEFDIIVPGQIVGTTGSVEIRCSGRVVRKENAAKAAAATKNGSSKTAKKSDTTGVACVIDSYEFVRK